MTYVPKNAVPPQAAYIRCIRCGEKKLKQEFPHTELRISVICIKCSHPVKK